MPSTTLSLTFELKHAPQPAILRGIGAFERSLKGAVKREGEQLALPVVLRDADNTHRMVIGPESFAFTHEPISRIERFGPGAVGLICQYLKHTRRIVPQEVELRAVLRIPVPNLNRLLTGLSTVTFTHPRKVELRPEAMGKDHFLASESGVAHYRLNTLVLSSGNWIQLLIANRCDHTGTTQEELEGAFAKSLRGMQTMIAGCTSTIYRQALGPIEGSVAAQAAARPTPPARPAPPTRPL